jgi:prophage antirepressor-like protein
MEVIMKNNNQIQQFHSDEFGNLEVLTINGKPYFPATECAHRLGYAKPHDAISRHCVHSVKHGVVSQTTNQHGFTTNQMVEKTFIPEGDLYRLIIRSKLPAAERFETWVFDEVLPTIRKHGAYATSDTLDELLRSPKFAETLIRKLEEERNKYNALEEVATEMAPKAIYCDLILQTKNAVPVSLIAKDYGMSAAAFNLLLNDFGVQYKVGGTWLLYQHYAGKGYTKTRTYWLSKVKSVMHTCWTQKGRLFLYDFLGDFGILPRMEADFDDLIA